MAEPLRIFVPSRWGTGMPQSLAVFEAFLEVNHFDPILKDRSTTQRLRYDQIAQVIVRHGVLFAELVIESRGGASAAVEGFRKAVAEEAREFIEERMRLRDAPQGSTPAATDIPDQIRKLAELRDAGIVSREEFEAKKADLLNRM